jgi:branched-chain amino acid transport system substrate-binding protein
VLFLAPNYVGGHDAATGFKRYYKGKLVEEMYTTLGQLDYAAELSQIRAARPEALYVFLPGGMGVNFIKQFVAAGLSKDMQLIVPLGAPTRTSSARSATRCSGCFSVGHWSIDMDNAATENSSPSPEGLRPPADRVRRVGLRHRAADRLGAAQGEGQDRGQGSAAHCDQGGRLQERARRLQVRTNQFPVQNYYLQLVGKGADGRLAHKTIGTVLQNRATCLCAGLQNEVAMAETVEHIVSSSAPP